MASDVARPVDLPARSRRQQLLASPGVGARRLVAVLQRDWAGSKAIAAGALVLVLAGLVAILFHVNSPNPFIPYHDTYEYIASADRILAGGAWVDPARMPGYPLLLAGTFLVAGKDNLAAADIVQHLLFVATAVEVYVLALRIWRDSRIAVAIGLVFAGNVYFFSYVKPILSDGLALFLTVALALALVSFLRKPGAGRFWAVTGLMLALIMTRAEWYLLPVPLFVYLLWMAHRQGGIRRLLPHALAAVALIYAVVGSYALLNGRVNGYTGLTDAQNINLYGKVTQYGMQDEASAQYAAITRITDIHIEDGQSDPWLIYWDELSLGENHFAGIGAYARNIILHHPTEFLKKSLPLTFTTLYDYRLFAPLNPAARAAKPLAVLQSFSAIVFPLFMLFPLCALVWLILLWRQRRSPHHGRAQLLCGLSLLTVYDLVMTTLGSYDEYTRLHLSFDPLMLIVVVGSLVLLLSGRHPAQPEEAT